MYMYIKYQTWMPRPGSDIFNKSISGLVHTFRNCMYIYPRKCGQFCEVIWGYLRQHHTSTKNIKYRFDYTSFFQGSFDTIFSELNNV